MVPVSILIHRALRLEGEEKEFWFVVNGVPIRYSIQEHAIISGLNCDNYSEGWTKRKGSEYRKKTFGTSKVTIEAALKKLRETPHANVEERKRLAIIVLLGGVLAHGAKSNDVINNDLVDMVESLDFCEGFPWGRYTFDKISDQIRKLYNSGPKPKDNWHCPGFVIPLMFLPFECIESLGANGWYIDVEGADPTCPRMCKKRIKPDLFMIYAKVYKQIGDTSKGFRSVLQIDNNEEHILLNVYAEPSSHPVVQSWMQRLNEDPTSICFQKILALDVERILKRAGVSVEVLNWSDKSESSSPRDASVGRSYNRNIDFLFKHRAFQPNEIFSPPEQDSHEQEADNEKICGTPNNSDGDMEDDEEGISATPPRHIEIDVEHVDDTGDLPPKEDASKKDADDASEKGVEDASETNKENAEDKSDSGVEDASKKEEKNAEDAEDKSERGVEDASEKGEENAKDAEEKSMENADNALEKSDEEDASEKDEEEKGAETDKEKRDQKPKVDSEGFATISEPLVPKEKSVYIWCPKEPVIDGCPFRDESFVQTSTLKATALFNFMKKPSEERLWRSGLNVIRPSQFWEDLLMEGIWLDNNHMDEALHEIRNRIVNSGSAQETRTSFFLCDVQCIENFKWWESGRTELGELEKYIIGELPFDGRNKRLDRYKGFVSVVNIPSLQNRYVSVHWITIKVDFQESLIQVFDCNRKMKEATLKVISHLSSVIPEIFALCGSGFIDFTKKFMIDIVKDLPHNETGNECGLYSLKFAEALMKGEENLLSEVNDQVMYYVREKIAADIFANGEIVTVHPS
ncbi:PREDICTED: uncharacterized protein LOC104807864 [Tarenaya hassleriana]|uniref:uncharacterized protein LOC104807864 n=1 Tax=Tarenaya hassleriana TaxID=28532 RepID=UPI00053C0A19|nr:PREDICTED: uncharacterized protein LOC104807864 [Tarenaya hassleriana]